MEIVSIGAGNLATHLIIALQKAGHKIVQIFSRTEISAKELSDKLQVPYTTEINCIVSNAQLYIISISDDAIEPFLENLSFTDQLLLHTSGSVSMDVFAKSFDNFGVLYPLQTFSKTRSINFSDIPFFIEANHSKNLKLIEKVAKSISNIVFFASSHKRMQLHLAAVFGCNFVNHLLNMSSQIVKHAGFKFSVLSPLLLETVHKAIISGNPKEVQTGPAIRNNLNILLKHKAMLTNRPEWQEIYTLLSEDIIKESDEKISKTSI